ncbi:MAG: hypothetical protein JWN40_1482 [Phycisphaerales bacterium]|nr:hypothetical protein [Phycisphaerales bacterium]
MKWTTVFLLIAASGASAQSSRPATRPAGHVWELTKYLHGTTTEVRDQLNGELERQLARKAETLKQIDSITRELKAREDEAVEFTRTRPDYLKLKRERDDAEQALMAARESGTAQQKLDASAKYNRARVALEKMEKDAPATYTQAADLRAKLTEAQGALKRSEEVVKQSGQWRDELLDAVQNGFKLRGPLRTGDEGLLARVTCEKILDGESALLTAEMQWGKGEVVGEKEGIAIVDINLRRVKLNVSGIDTSKLKEGQDVVLDRNVRILKAGGGGDAVYLAKHHVNDVDELFATIVPLRAPAVVAPGPPKAESAPLGGLRGLAELLPTDQLAALGKGPAPVQELRAQKWLDEHAVGRTIRLSGVLRGAVASGDEFSVAMSADKVKLTGGGAADAEEIHARFAKSHERLLTRVKKGERLVIQGSIQRLTVIVENGTISFVLHLGGCEPAK